MFKSSEVEPQSRILRSLSMFFFTRHLHVEDAKRIPSFKASGNMLQVFVYHATENNLKSQFFRAQLLDHLESNATVVLLRRADLNFSAMLAYFVNGCVIELKNKLKCAYERAVTVVNERYEEAVLDLVKEIKKIQLRSVGKNNTTPHTFPLMFGDNVASLSFGTSARDIKIESVMKVSGFKELAVKLRKKPDAKTRKRATSDSSQKSKCLSTETDFNGPLAVKSIQLHMRKTVYESNKSYNPGSSQNEGSCQNQSQRSCHSHDQSYEDCKLEAAQCETLIKEQLNEISEERDDVEQHSYSSTASDEPAIDACSEQMHTLNSSLHTLIPPLTVSSRQSHKTLSPKAKSPDDTDKSICNYLDDAFADDDYLKYQTSKTYAVYIPDRWGENGEQLIYISFPDESDKVPCQVYDFPCSGFSTPCSLNLSERCLSPIESPLITIPKAQSTIYPEPCPIYPLESSFPPVDLPVNLSS